MKNKINYSSKALNDPKINYAFNHREINQIFKSWLRKLSKQDKENLVNLENNYYIFSTFIIFYSWKSIKSKNKKEFSLYLCKFLKIYLAVIWRRGTEEDLNVINGLRELPFKLERITRGDDPNRKIVAHKQKYLNIIADHKVEDMLLTLCNSEEILIKFLSKDDEANAVDNFLLTYGACIVSFFILNKGKEMFGERFSFSKGIVETMAFYMENKPTHTKKSKLTPFHLFAERFIASNRYLIKV